MHRLKMSTFLFEYISLTGSHVVENEVCKPKRENEKNERRKTISNTNIRLLRLPSHNNDKSVRVFFFVGRLFLLLIKILNNTSAAVHLMRRNQKAFCRKFICE